MAHLRPTSLTTNIRIHARELDLQPDLRLLPRHPRSLLRGVEQTHRPALAHHVHRPARLCSPVLITRTWYKDRRTLPSAAAVFFLPLSPAARPAQHLTHRCAGRMAPPHTGRGGSLISSGKVAGLEPPVP